jgi:hypothetical protein
MFHICRVEVESDMEPMLDASEVEQAWKGLEKPKKKEVDYFKNVPVYRGAKNAR